MKGLRRRLLMALMNKKSTIPTENGVYIQDIDGTFWKKEEWNQDNSRANGVAVIDSKHPKGGFIIYPSTNYNVSAWSAIRDTIHDISTTTDYNTAVNDFNGVMNTSHIYYFYLNDDYYSARLCNDRVFKNGNKGYLPSLGELNMIYGDPATNTEIVECLKIINGGDFFPKEAEIKWSSTQYDYGNAWTMQYENSYIQKDKTTNNIKVIPITSLEKQKDGLYILGKDNKLYTKFQWNKTKDGVVGLAIIDRFHPRGGFVIAVQDIFDINWSKVEENVEGATITSSNKEARSNFKGFEDSAIILNRYLEREDYAVGACNAYIFPNGNKGYLGSVGEWVMLNNRNEEVDDYLNFLGLSLIRNTGSYWTSVQYGATHAFVYLWTENRIAFESKTKFIGIARPFSELPDGYSFYKPSREEKFSIIMKRNESNPQNITIEGEDTEMYKKLTNWKRCLCKKTGEGKVSICYLGDTNSNYFHDMSTASDLTGAMGDVMTVIPEFWYKYRNIDDDYFAYDVSDKPINGGVHIEKSLVGTFKAAALNIGTTTQLFSRVNATAQGNTSYNDFIKFAEERGKGYQIIDFQQHSMIAMMAYAKTKTRNLQAVWGVGNANHLTYSGTTAKIGNVDTVNTNTGHVNGLAIEGVYGCVFEFVKGVEINNHVWKITDTDGSTRNVNAGTSDGWITNVAAEIGPFFDMVPTKVGGSDTTHYSDYYAQGDGSYVLARSYNDSFTVGGVAFAYAYSDASYTYSDYGSRLAFRGEITEIDDIQEFIAIDGGVTKDDLTDGVWILRTNNKYYKKDDWNTAWNAEAVGVAVVDSRHPNKGFVIAPTQNNNRLYWSPSGVQDGVSGVTTTTNSSTAKTDYEGVSNSSAIVSKYGVYTDYATGWCRNYSFKNGKKGYLGSCGEWQEAYNNKAEIDACMSLIGGTTIATDDDYWNSTQYDSTSAWRLYWSNGDVDYNTKNYTRRVRAFSVLY